MNFLFTTFGTYAMILCVLVSSSGVSLHFVLMAVLNFTYVRIKVIPFDHQNLVKSLKPLVVVCVCNILL
jgi:hypothetical protein